MGYVKYRFTGIEIAGEVLTSASTCSRASRPTWPVTELADRWLPHATADQFDEALALVSEEAARMLVGEWGFTIEDAFIFLSVACDVASLRPANRHLAASAPTACFLDPQDRGDAGAVPAQDLTPSDDERLSC